jgi:hypothetical protein
MQNMVIEIRGNMQQLYLIFYLMNVFLYISILNSIISYTAVLKYFE